MKKGEIGKPKIFKPEKITKIKTVKFGCPTCDEFGICTNRCQQGK